MLQVTLDRAEKFLGLRYDLAGRDERPGLDAEIVAEIVVSCAWSPCDLGWKISMNFPACAWRSACGLWRFVQGVLHVWILFVNVSLDLGLKVFFWYWTCTLRAMSIM